MQPQLQYKMKKNIKKTTAMCFRLLQIKKTRLKGPETYLSGKIKEKINNNI